MTPPRRPRPGLLRLLAAAALLLAAALTGADVDRLVGRVLDGRDGEDDSPATP